MFASDLGGWWYFSLIKNFSAAQESWSCLYLIVLYRVSNKFPSHAVLYLILSLAKSRCPRELCAKAKPFEGASSQVVETTTTTSTSTTTTTEETAEPIQPPIHQQICIQAAIKNNFYSLIGNEYCIETCQGKPMDVCNLYLCYCTTQWLSTKNFWKKGCVMSEKMFPLNTISERKSRCNYFVKFNFDMLSLYYLW